MADLVWAGQAAGPSPAHPDKLRTLAEIPGRHNRTPINDGETGHKGNGKRGYSADHDAVGAVVERGAPASGQQAHAYANEQVGCADDGKKPRESLCDVG